MGEKQTGASRACDLIEDAKERAHLAWMAIREEDQISGEDLDALIGTLSAIAETLEEASILVVRLVTRDDEDARWAERRGRLGKLRETLLGRDGSGPQGMRHMHAEQEAEEQQPEG